MPTVRFVNELTTVEVAAGTSLRDAAIRSGIEVYRGMWTHLNCRGNGICGRCTVWVLTPGARRTLRERAHRVQGSQRLACQVRIDGDLDVRTRPLGPATVQAPHAVPAYLVEAEKRLATAREEAKRDAEKKAREAAKPKPEAKPAEAPASTPASPAATQPEAAPAPTPEAPSEAKPG